MTTSSLNGRVNFRVTAGELAEIRCAADAAGLSLSDYVKKRVLGRVVANERDLLLRAELARLGDLIATHATAHVDPSELRRALDAIVAASQRLRSSGADHHDR